VDVSVDEVINAGARHARQERLLTDAEPSARLS
jgi:hypothetical protein